MNWNDLETRRAHLRLPRRAAQGDSLLLCLFMGSTRAEDCIASVYSVGDRSHRGTRTASGTPFDDNAMTAAIEFNRSICPEAYRSSRKTSLPSTKFCSARP